MFREYDLDIGVNTVRVRIANRIYYYHIGFVLSSFNAYGMVNVVFYFGNRYRTETDTDVLQLHGVTDKNVLARDTLHIPIFLVLGPQQK